jgi:CRP-like cAMP-binding protein
VSELDARTVAILRKNPLFLGISGGEIETMLACLKVRIELFGKGDCIFRQGDPVPALGVVLDGSVFVEAGDYWGNVNILDRVGAGGMFGEAFACMPGVASPVNAVAAQKSKVLLLDAARVIATCPSACDFHLRLVRNLLTAMARKNLVLTQKVGHVTKRTTREKVLSYLSTQSLVQGSSSFDIPFNRQQLADYLSVERSALSSCLGKMQEEGVISFRKNHFRLI